MTRNRIEISFVSLESRAFLMDQDFIRMTDSERGVYCTLIFFLYCNDGKCEFDRATLARLCNSKNFEGILKNIEKKFQIRNGVIKHKRVTKELREAKRRRQAKSKAGIKGMKQRWNKDNTVITNEKRNVIDKEKDSYSYSSTADQSFSSPTSVRVQSLHFNEALISIIRPRSQSDRTCFRNVTNWLVEGCAKGRFNNQIFERVLDYAKEVQNCRNPAAAFMSLLSKELEYRAKSIKTADSRGQKCENVKKILKQMEKGFTQK